jgi:hypothetical protein
VGETLSWFWQRSTWLARSLRKRKATEGIDEGRAHVPARVVGARYNSTPIFLMCYGKYVV